MLGFDKHQSEAQTIKSSTNPHALKSLNKCEVDVTLII